LLSERVRVSDFRCRTQVNQVTAFTRNWTASCGVPLLAFAAMSITPACAARLYADPVQASGGPYGDDGIVYVDTAPVNIELYPHYGYDGGQAYYVDGRWYHQGPRGWGYYRQEPPELQRQRGYAQQAAPASRDRSYVQQAPQAQREHPGVANTQGRSEEARGASQPEKRAAPADRRPPPNENRTAPPEKHEEHGR